MLEKNNRDKKVANYSFIGYKKTNGKVDDNIGVFEGRNGDHIEVDIANFIHDLTTLHDNKYRMKSPILGKVVSRIGIAVGYARHLAHILTGRVTDFKREERDIAKVIEYDISFGIPIDELVERNRIGEKNLTREEAEK